MSSGQVENYTGPSGGLKADSEWLGFEDMPVGRDVVVTIKTALILDGVPMQQGHKYSGGGLEFEEGKKNKMLLNSGNRRILAGLFTTDTGQWAGKRIAIYGDPTVMFGRKNTGGVVIRDKAADAMRQRAADIAAPPPEPEPEEETGAGVEPSSEFSLDNESPTICDGTWGMSEGVSEGEACELGAGHTGHCGPKDE